MNLLKCIGCVGGMPQEGNVGFLLWGSWFGRCDFLVFLLVEQWKGQSYRSFVGSSG